MSKVMGLSGKKGFTLVEALTASVILAIGLFVVGLAIYAEFSFINQNREKTIATLSAQEEIEAIRGMAFDDILNLGSSFTASGFTYLRNPVGTLAVENFYGVNNIRKVSISVEWDSLTGRRLKKSLVTMVSRNGINRQ